MTFAESLFQQYKERGFHAAKLEVTNDEPVAVIISMNGMTMLIDSRSLPGVAAHVGVSAYSDSGVACEIDYVDPIDGSALFNVRLLNTQAS